MELLTDSFRKTSSDFHLENRPSRNFRFLITPKIVCPVISFPPAFEMVSAEVNARFFTGRVYRFFRLRPNPVFMSDKNKTSSFEPSLEFNCNNKNPIRQPFDQRLSPKGTPGSYKENKSSVCL